MMITITTTFAIVCVSEHRHLCYGQLVCSQRGPDFTLALAVIWHTIKAFVPYTVHNRVQKIATMNPQFSFFSEGYNVRDRNRNSLDVLKQNDFSRQG